MRRGFTTLESLIALAVSVIVLGGIMSLWSLGSRMHRASQATIAIQGALSITEALFADLKQMGLEPGVAPYVIGADRKSVSFYKVDFRPDRIALVPVRFHTVPTPNGNVYLAKTVRKPGGQLDTTVFRTCPLFGVLFDRSTDQWGNDYLRAAVTVLDGDTPRGQATPERERSVFQQVVVRTPVPDRFGDPAFSKVNILQREGDLLPP